ncbi:uncharacterized protein K452DRAFT_225499 [Aplosporella prunicola CBS 121167]|uniref:Uncharacterized protein n=1 Tax=Aplosporella prunicola CBS 121167 TaxID=1176127 RepID=A0A6A6BIT4_9PEZI|nr:uncharacterized protein K452DRAFT_225499 [Aplosporella prunicola CBS 121167]KAF2143333.1 hypothetical protein K452DRAFT_225499 [Aplosporella prunicola CBS 121167]
MPPKESSNSQQQGQGQNASTTGHQTFGANVVPSGSQGQPFRGGKQQDNESGRGTPPPSSAAGEMTEEEILQLRKEHDILREKYQKVKRYFFDQQSQVHQLQNTIAHQRLSQSRTSLDDSEYSSRFNRLDGLISQLAFVIRKDWKSIPEWLHRAVNRDAVTIGKQEMTAVGRAFISNWLVDEIFNKYFHPDLETNLSMQLKIINTNIRKSAPLAQTSDEEEALTAKVVNWRLATLDGLGEHLRAPQAHTNRESLIAILNEKLIGTLQMYLKEPAPPDLQSNVPMIIELAINIAAHLPLESRDVCIEYYPPGHGIMGEQMKIESGVPALVAPLAEGLFGGPGKDDAASVASATSFGGDGGNGANKSQSAPQQETKRSTGRNMFSGLMGGKPKAATVPLQQQLGGGKAGGAGGSQVSLSTPGSAGGPAKEEQPPRVRIAAGVSVRIWGRSVLVKAPVFPTS